MDERLSFSLYVLQIPAPPANAAVTTLCKNLPDQGWAAVDPFRDLPAARALLRRQGRNRFHFPFSSSPLFWGGLHIAYKSQLCRPTTIFLGGENISLSTSPTNSALFTSTTSALCTSTTLCMGMGRDILGLSGHTVVNGFLSFVLFIALTQRKNALFGHFVFCGVFWAAQNHSKKVMHYLQACPRPPSPSSVQ